MTTRNQGFFEDPFGVFTPGEEAGRGFPSAGFIPRGSGTIDISDLRHFGNPKFRYPGPFIPPVSGELPIPNAPGGAMPDPTGVGPTGNPTITSGNINDVAFQQIFRLLTPGAKSPTRAANTARRNIIRGTQAQQQTQQGELARRGLLNSGIGQALMAATGAAGEQRLAGFEAQEVQRREQQLRQDLVNLFLRPLTDFAAIEAGQFAGQQNRNDQRDAARDARNLAIFGILAKYGLEYFRNRRDRNSGGGSEEPTLGTGGIGNTTTPTGTDDPFFDFSDPDRGGFL